MPGAPAAGLAPDDARRGADGARHGRRLRAAPPSPRLQATNSPLPAAGQHGARALYDAMETARCEAVGARTMPGTAGNIDAKIGAEATRKGYGQITARAGPAGRRRGLHDPPSGHRPPPARAARQRAGPVARSSSRTDRRPARWRSLEDIVLATRQAFAKLRPRIDRGSGLRRPAGRRPRRRSTRTSRRRGRARGEDDRSPDSTGEDDRTRKRMPTPPPSSPRNRPGRSQAGRSMDDMADQDAGRGGRNARTARPRMEPPPPPPVSDADPNYEVYRPTADDEVIAPRIWPNRPELERLRAYLDQQLDPLKGAVSRLANKLQRRLQAQQNRSPGNSTWRRASSMPGVWRGWWPARRRRCRSRWRRTPNSAIPVVTLLLDNSGSMRGRPIHRGDLRRRAGPHAGALRRQGRDPGLHHPRLEGRSGARGLAEGGGPASPGG